MPQIYHLYGPANDSQSVSESKSLPEKLSVSGGEFLCQHTVLGNGISEGVEMLMIQGEQIGIAIVPTRGMGIWRAWVGETEIGWKSPVKGPVHPAYVPVSEPSGLGWLTGFDELLVRCGLESNGAPEFTSSGQLKYPLHGRIANLPAESLRVVVDEQERTVSVIGTVRESRLFFTNWTLESQITIPLDDDWIAIEDRVTNHGDQPNRGQLLYHINIGPPVLGTDARLIAPYERVVPKTARAVAGIDTFDLYGAPQPGFAEQVYLMQLQQDADNWSKVLLHSAEQELGIGVEIDCSTLPYFVQWKNTGGLNDGYVTGLEPSTNFPNTRSFEEQHDRTFQLAAGESRLFQLNLRLLEGVERIQLYADSIDQLRQQAGTVDSETDPQWCE